MSRLRIDILGCQPSDSYLCMDICIYPLPINYMGMSSITFYEGSRRSSKKRRPGGTGKSSRGRGADAAKYRYFRKRAFLRQPPQGRIYPYTSGWLHRRRWMSSIICMLCPVIIALLVCVLRYIVRSLFAYLYGYMLIRFS